jgi:SAM-dependent methyltransferase
MPLSDVGPEAPPQWSDLAMSVGLSDADLAAAPCLAEGALAEPARAVVASVRNLGTAPWAAVLRAWCVPYLFGSMERVFQSDAEPSVPLAATLERLSAFLHVAACSGFDSLPEDGGTQPLFSGDVKTVTGEHYGRLFQAFSASSYGDEPIGLLRTRLERNGLPVEGFAGKHVLDAGCGGGRYSVAWRFLGAGRVTGADISSTGLNDARQRVHQAHIDGVEFVEADILDLPFESNHFDVVFSNGVLHHTTDWQAGVSELVRVLKPGGTGWLYMIERPGGLFWDVIEILRVILRGESRARARAALSLLGVPPNRVFYMLDHVMVPINLRLTPAEIESSLAGAGASDIRRLTRGTDFDRVEQITRGERWASVKYGVGENRFVFSKP